MKTVSCFLLTTLLSVGLGSSAVMADVGGELSQPVITENTTQYYAQRPRRGINNRRQGRIIEQLNLSQEQTQELVSIREKYKPRFRSLREQMRKAHEEMRQMMTGNVSQAELRAKNEEINQLNQKIDELRFESLLEMREVLTPEQRQEFAQIMEQRREMRGSSPRRRSPREESEDLMP
jgi:Spy/CpxP family protein refolding chaperone